MTLLIVTLAVLPALLCIFLFAVMPRTTHQEQCRQFEQLSFAHRGLFNMEAKIPENSMAAFRRAVELGFPIELDVQLTKDKQAVIFHDDSLKRMCGIDELLCNKTYDELCQLSLQDTQERIPLFSDVLNMVDGRVPLLVELKTIGKNTMVSVVANELLRRYKGPFCIEAFSPFVLRWFKEHHPDIIRGQLSEHFRRPSPHPGLLLFMAENLLFNWYSKPDFISYSYHYAKKCFSLKIIKYLFNAPIFAWTIRSAEAYRQCQKQFDSIIFDSFMPMNAKDKGR